VGLNLKVNGVASYQVQMGHVEQAPLGLKQSRALLWSGMHGLLTSVDHLTGVNPRLATQLPVITVNRGLETLMTSIPPCWDGELGVGGTHMRTGWMRLAYF
jgi:hypothetical protein